MINPFVILILVMLVSCAGDKIENQNTKGLIFQKIETDYSVKDINSYDCDKITKKDLVHVLETGELTAEMDIHDYYSYTGCSIEGSIEVNSDRTGFKFDYGGILKLDNGQIIGCGEKCCVKGFNYCSWDKDGLK